MTTRIRLLVVDDSVHIRKVIAEILSPHPRFLLAGEAADGLEALEHVKALRPTTVLLDIRMPHMDGFETAVKIRERENPPDIVMMTEHEGDEYPKKAISIGACAFLWKHDLDRELLPILQSLYDQPGSQRPSV